MSKEAKMGRIPTDKEVEEARNSQMFDIEGKGTRILTIKADDMERFRSGVMESLNGFRMQEFGNTRIFAFRGLQVHLNSLIDALMVGKIKQVVMDKGGRKEVENEEKRND
jgi:hypothetical protein